jgi:hypothetical protein
MQILLLLIATGVLVGGSAPAFGAGGAGQTAPASRDRRAFAAAFGKARVGMKEREVVRALGPPDDVRTETDPGGIQAARTSKVLLYKEHLACATVGQVYTQFDYRERGTRVDHDAVRSAMKLIKQRFHGLRIGYRRVGVGLGRGDWGGIAKIVEEELSVEDHTLVELPG